MTKMTTSKSLVQLNIFKRLKEDVGLKQHLKRIGGATAGDCARNMLNRTLALEVQVKMNMQGRPTIVNGKKESKIAFAKSQMYKLIVGIVTKKYKVADTEIKSAIEVKLRNAPKQLRQKADGQADDN